jgi:glyoxylate utilization-related uncharacterized protein
LGQLAAGGWQTARSSEMILFSIYFVWGNWRLVAGDWQTARSSEMILFQFIPFGGNWKMENRNWKVADLKINSNKELAQN